jgi:AcrR family transcriptional regulator
MVYIGRRMPHRTLQSHLKSAPDARAIRTREALRSALLRLLERHALDRITIRDLCAASAVGYTTFFRHYPSIEALLDDVAAEQIGQLLALVMPVADATDMRAGSVALFAYVNEHRKLWSSLLTGGAAGALRAEFMRLASQIAATRTRPGVWPPAEVVTILVVGSTIELLSWWLRQKRPLTIAQIAAIHDRVVVAPAVNAERPPAERPSAQRPLVPRRPARPSKAPSRRGDPRRRRSSGS